MRLRMITPTLHGVIDYSAGIGLILVPFLLQLGESNSMAIWVSVAMGGAVLVASALTDYRLGLLRTIPFDGHLAIDLAAATDFMLTPFVLDMHGLDMHYYLANAAVVYLVVGLSDHNEPISNN